LYSTVDRGVDPPLAVGHQARGLGSAIISRSGVWGKAPGEIEFGAF